MRFMFYVYIALLPVFLTPQLSILGGKFQFADVLIPLAVISLLYSLFTKKLKLIKTPIYLPVLIFLTAHIGSIFNATNLLKGILEIFGLVYLMGVFFVTLHTLNSEKSLNKFLISWMIGLSIVVVCGFVGLIEVFILNKASFFMLDRVDPGRYQLVHGVFPRVISTMKNPNMLMSYFVVSTGVLLGFFHSTLKKPVRVWLILLLLSLLFLSFFTASRDIVALLICLAIGILVFKSRSVLFAKFVSISLTVTALLVLFAVIFLTFFEPSNIYLTGSDLEGEQTVVADFHRSNRYYFFKYAFQMFADHPFIGIGAGGFNGKLPHYYFKDPQKDPNFLNFTAYDPHSSFSGLAAETGSFGLLSFLGIFFVLFLNFRNTYKSSQLVLKMLIVGTAAGLSGIIVQGLTMDVQNLRHLWVLFGLGAAIVNLKVRLS